VCTASKRFVASVIQNIHIAATFSYARLYLMWPSLLLLLLLLLLLQATSFLLFH
jgi:hypothetical protein